MQLGRQRQLVPRLPLLLLLLLRLLLRLDVQHRAAKNANAQATLPQLLMCLLLLWEHGLLKLLRTRRQRIAL